MKAGKRAELSILLLIMVIVGAVNLVAIFLTKVIVS